MHSNRIPWLVVPAVAVVALLLYSMARAGVADGFAWQWQALETKVATVSMPGQPVMEKRAVTDRSIGAVASDLQFTSFQSKKEQVVFGLTTLDLPAEFISANPEQALDGLRQMVVSRTRGDLAYERHLRWQEEPMREVVVSLPNGNTAEVRIVIHSRQAVQLAVVHPTERFSGAVDRYFSSLRLLPASR